MTLIYLMDIWQKMFQLNRFFLIIQMYLSGVPPLCPNPQWTPGLFFLFSFFEADYFQKQTFKTAADHCQSKLYTNVVITERIDLFVF